MRPPKPSPRARGRNSNASAPSSRKSGGAFRRASKTSPRPPADSPTTAGTSTALGVVDQILRPRPPQRLRRRRPAAAGGQGRLYRAPPLSRRVGLGRSATDPVRRRPPLPRRLARCRLGRPCGDTLGAVHAADPAADAGRTRHSRQRRRITRRATTQPRRLPGDGPALPNAGADSAYLFNEATGSVIGYGPTQEAGRDWNGQSGPFTQGPFSYVPGSIGRMVAPGRLLATRPSRVRGRWGLYSTADLPRSRSTVRG